MITSPTKPAGWTVWLAVFAALLTAAIGVGHHRASASARTVSIVPAATAPTKPSTKVYAYYYLWWSTSHWVGSLGRNYPTSRSPLPLPARLGADGCKPVTNFAGNILTDVPTKLSGQDDPGAIAADVRAAASAGLAGFYVNWAGSGTAQQTLDSNPYNRRLQTLVDAVHAINRQGTPFSLWISYKASAATLSPTAMTNDLAYLRARYGSDPAFDRSQSRRLSLIWQGSRKYSESTLALLSSRFRSTFRLLGDESAWSAARARYLDGDAYYWSSQDPYRNPQSFTQLASLAASVRASGANPDGSRKAFIAPLTPGFDKQLAGGTNCVPRRSGATMRALFAGNGRTQPDDWGLISWNEVVEGTYVEPLQRYGQQDLDVIRSLTRAG